MCHLANKYEDIVNFSGAEAYCVATRTACSFYIGPVLFVFLVPANLGKETVLIS